MTYAQQLSWTNKMSICVNITWEGKPVEWTQPTWGSNFSSLPLCSHIIGVNIWNDSKWNKKRPWLGIVPTVSWNWLRRRNNKSNDISFLFAGKNKVNGKIQSTYEQVHSVVGANLLTFFFKDNGIVFLLRGREQPCCEIPRLSTGHWGKCLMI